ncbi:IucA/IucC family siderophore biosynthesis protein [Marinobacter sp. MDS2]|uniref:IucA/IucC family protein n=1 Tax=Marinobacter sp. MDS2 TaxID=3065961 RepID=UPI00273CE719|nr:IucA/IucC family protein [Marinobacter sp. MDS2]MDP4547545.1 IucA/IucC family protein [Marinobacter sp. MDS2]
MALRNPVAEAALVPALAETPRQRVLRQLLEALLFEGLVPCYKTDSRSGSWQWLDFPVGTLQARCRGRVRGFSRVRLDIESLSFSRRQRPVAVDLPELIQELPGSRSQHQQLLEELNATIANEEQLRNSHQTRTLNDRRSLHGEALDRAIHEGHPYHPCFKSRLGFGADDLMRYSPETSTGFRLHWVAVPRRYLDSQLPASDLAFWQAELGEETAFLLRAAFHRVGIDWQAYGAMPMHPWQWRHLSTGPLAKQLGDVDIRDLGPLGDRYQPSQSLRSLFNMNRPGQACLKLPLGIHNTSSRRHLEPHSVPSAPAISRWLEAIVESDPRLSRDYPLRLLPEYASLSFIAQPGTLPGQHPLEGELAAIWRTSLRARLNEDEQAIPLNALFQWQPDGQPFIESWIERYGLEPWLNATLSALILPVWHMLAAHGVGLEAHAQNSLLVMRQGWPNALLLRDFHDSVEYARNYLAAATPEPDLGERQAAYDQAPDDLYYRMSGPEALRELAVDTLFIYNLSELALLLEDAYGFAETRFWAQVRTLLDQYAQQHPELQRRLSRLGWDQPRLKTESLLTQKLQPDTGNVSHWVPNPLAITPTGFTTSFTDHQQARLS